MEEEVTKLKKFIAFVICRTTSMAIIFLTLKIYRPSLMGKTPPHWKGDYFSNGTDTHYAEVFDKGIDPKKLILWIWRDKIILGYVWGGFFFYYLRLVPAQDVHFYKLTLIWVHLKVVSQLSQSIPLQPSCLNILWHNSFLKCVAYQLVLKTFPRLLSKLTYNFISTNLSCFVKNANLRFTSKIVLL